MAIILDEVQETVLVKHPTDPTVTFICRRSDPYTLGKIYRSNKIIKRGRRGTEEDVDTGKFGEQNFIHTVQDWEGIEASKGKPLECTEENKRMVYKKMNNLSQFVLSEVQRIEDEEMDYQVGN